MAEQYKIFITGGAGYLGLSDVNKPFRGWKISQFEGGIRVPLFMKWPARIEAGTRSPVPVAHIDMMPTLLAAAQAPEHPPPPTIATAPPQPRHHPSPDANPTQSSPPSPHASPTDP